MYSWCIHFCASSLALSPLQAQQLLDHQDFKALTSMNNNMVDLPGGSFFSTWEFIANVDSCEFFNGVQCVIVDGINIMGSIFLDSQFIRTPRLLGTLIFALESLVYLTQLMIYASEVQGLLPSSLRNLQNLKVFSCDHNQISCNIPNNFANL